MKYTNALLEELKNKYLADPKLENVDKLSKEYNIPRRSLISKLSAAGIYQKKVYVTKEGTKPIKKEFYIEEISELLDIDMVLLESLEKCTKQSLKLLVDGINSLKAELN